MGFFGKMIGSVDSDVMASPLVGRGEVIGVKQGNVVVSHRKHDPNAELKCTITLKVMLDLQPAYQAETVQRVKMLSLAALSSGAAVVAVRVDEKDRSKVAIDFSIPAPTVRMPRNEGPGSAVWVLANGKPVTVIIVASSPSGLQNADGIDGHVLTMTVVDGVPTPYQTKIVNAVPATALPLLYPGSKVHAMLGDNPNFVIVDWSKGPVKA